MWMCGLVPARGAPVRAGAPLPAAQPAKAVPPVGVPGYPCTRAHTRRPRAPYSQPWWNDEAGASGAATSVAWELGVVQGTGIAKVGPYFSWCVVSDRLRSTTYVFRLNTTSMSDIKLNLVNVHSVVSTPPLTVYTDAPAAVVELVEGAAPLQLSMTNMSCGSPPCIPR